MSGRRQRRAARAEEGEEEIEIEQHCRRHGAVGGRALHQLEPHRARERPKPTTHTSKLMQTRRKVSASRRRMAYAPKGMPMSTLGTIHDPTWIASALNSPSW